MTNAKEFFANYKSNKITLYGLGIETEKVLTNLENHYEIIGLLEGFKEEGE